MGGCDQQKRGQRKKNGGVVVGSFCSHCGCGWRQLMECDVYTVWGEISYLCRQVEGI
eukprot:NODE_1196_length_1039_cov_185.766667_g827_i0.p3 GENE.NODE_1196_length_1039_cov_185.766667_g827_i0~~NODE_1196_length_1039_cov_185.766667_g827_i0.p3  ORF type:complete len:65 (-),score=12.36 NODE_1196_length_1039_cov_185.766667_g827_i0:845-1015(-)